MNRAATLLINTIRQILNVFAIRVGLFGVYEESRDVYDDLFESRGMFYKASWVLTPSAFTEGILPALKPFDGSGDLTFTRATSATRTDADGVIGDACYNLFSYSEQFDNAFWTKTQTAVTTNTITAPNGTSTADKIIPNTTNIQHRIDKLSFSTGLKTLSVYAKAGEYGFLGLRIGDLVDDSASFDLSDGSFGVVGANILNYNAIDAGDGWYRCYITVDSGASLAACRLNIGESINALSSFAGNDVSGLYLWGAQLVQGSVAKPYLPTTDRLNVPRIDYSLGGCPVMLVEPQRTNIVLRSEEFDNAIWSTFGDGTLVTANTDVSPAGTLTSDTITGGGGLGRIGQIGIACLASTNYTFSIYVKNIDATNFIVFIYDNVGTLLVSANQIPNVTIGDYTRLIFTVTTNIGASTISVQAARSLPTSESIYFWGAQLEAGAYATSYISTTTVAVTRNADSVPNKNIGAANINSEEGVLFLHSAALFDDGTFRVISLNDGTVNNRLFIGYQNASQTIQATYTVGGSTTGNITAIVADVTVFSKIAFRYKEDDFSLWIDGVKVGEDLSGSVLAPNTLVNVGFTSGTTGSPFYAMIKEAAHIPYFPSDDFMTELTTL
jgi:hypothetical protein